MSDEEREARHGRDRRRPVSETTLARWRRRAEALEAAGHALLQTTRETQTGEAKDALAYFAAAEKIWGRLHRVGATKPPPAGDSEPTSTPGAPSLAAYRSSRRA